MNQQPKTENDQIREAVRVRYGATALQFLEQTDQAATGRCCSGSCDPITSNHYSDAEAAQIPEAALLASLGCGNPTALAELRPGEVVLDLGSGGGIDVLLSARRVGPSGHAYGLDMTDEMLALAEKNKQASGAENVTFLKGHMEAIPLPDESVDVVISNCVINLSVDKDKVLQEAFRVLRPGGRFAVSDVVVDGTLPEAVRRDMEAYVGCVAGAMERSDYESKLARAGFVGASIEPVRRYRFADLESSTVAADAVAQLTDAEREALDGRVMGAFIRAVKPGAPVKLVEVFDPALCCSTGVCGPSVDPNLVRIARDLAWLGRQPGVRVERYNLAQQPQAFATNEIIRSELQKGVDVLPLILVDGRVLASGSYPDREALCEAVGIDPGHSSMQSGLKMVQS
jgi:SAM-dependent methyltransferase